MVVLRSIRADAPDLGLVVPTRPLILEFDTPALAEQCLGTLEAHRRHVLSSDEYSPSRRRSALTSPGRVQCSASANTHSLYSAVNPRRLAFSTISASFPRASSSTALIAPAWVALHTKLLGTNCLTHIDSEDCPCWMLKCWILNLTQE